MDYELKYGLDAEGHFVSIKQVVANGLSCGCVCPNCKQQLIAKTKGDKRKPHFAHYNPMKSADKKICYEQTMHKLAKELIKEEMSIMLPALDCINSQKVSFKKVEIEERNDSKDLQPDIVGITEDNQRIVIEIKCTHAVDSSKLRKIIDKNLICLEVDVSNCNMDKTELHSFLHESDKDREWLNNPDYEDRIIEYYSSSYDSVVIVEKKEDISDKIFRRYNDVVVVSEIERYKQKEYQIKGRKKTVLGHALPSKKVQHRIISSGVHTNAHSFEEGNDRLLFQSTKSRQADYVQKQIERTRQATIAKDNSKYCLCPKTINENALNEYYDSLHPHAFFYDDGRIKSKITNYKQTTSGFFVIHVYCCNGHYRTRLTFVEYINGKIQHTEIDDYYSEISAERKMVGLLE